MTWISVAMTNNEASEWKVVYKVQEQTKTRYIEKKGSLGWILQRGGS